MNKVVQLVNEWAEFEEQHPQGTLEDFCRFYLLKRQEITPGHEASSCPEDYANLLKSMGRILAAYNIYHRAAMAKTELPFAEAFFFLNILANAGPMKKTELINALYMEYTTGMEAINKLLKAGLVSEREDENDRRAKQLSITPKGQTALHSGYPYMGKLSDMVFGQISADHIKLCQLLLSEIEGEHGKIAAEMKNRDFDEIYHLLMSKSTEK